MSKCPYCGKTIPLLYKSCGKCGYKVPEEEVRVNKGKSICLIALGVVCVIGIEILFSGGSNEPQPTKSVNTITEAPSTISLRKIESKEQQMHIETVDMGTPVNVENLICNASDWYFTDKIGSYDADSDKSFLIVQASVKNEDTSTKRMQDFEFYILYQDKYQYLPTFLSTDEYIQYHDTIIPLETIDGILAFQVPDELEDASDIKLVATRNLSDYQYQWQIKLNK